MRGSLAKVRLAALLVASFVGASCTRAELKAVTGSSPSDADANVGDGIDARPDAALDTDGGPGGGSGRCPSGPLPVDGSTRMVSVGGTNRSYLLHVPTAYDGTKAVALMLDFHALNGEASQERANSPYPAQTDPEAVIMAFPTGLMGPSGTAWSVGPCCVANVDDVAFSRAVVSDVESIACIDARRVYAVGTSMGGGMAYYLACRAADVFAAVAPAAFDLFQDNVADCKPSRAITVISFRGRADTLVPYAGGASAVVKGMPVTFLGAQATFQKWADLDGCTGAPSAEDRDGCSRYSGCQGGAEVILCSKAGGGQEAGNASIAWPVLRAHTL